MEEGLRRLIVIAAKALDAQGSKHQCVRVYASTLGSACERLPAPS